MYDPVAFVKAAPLGMRVVIRRRITDGFTDAVGYLRERTETWCMVETRRGNVTINLSDITAAKEVPPPPERRRPQSS